MTLAPGGALAEPGDQMPGKDRSLCNRRKRAEARRVKQGRNTQHDAQNRSFACYTGSWHRIASRSTRSAGRLHV